MRKSLGEPIVSRHIEIYEEDWDFLLLNFGKGTPHNFGVSRIIRDIVHHKVKALRAKQIEKLDEMAPGEDLKDSRVMERIAEVRRDRELDELDRLNIVDPGLEQ